jgi:hypothetical protein
MDTTTCIPIKKSDTTRAAILMSILVAENPSFRLQDLGDLDLTGENLRGRFFLKSKFINNRLTNVN